MRIVKYYRNINPKRYGIILLMTTLLLASSCHQQQTFLDSVPIDIVNKHNPIQIDIYDIVDSISYIPLETSNNCLLGDIQCVKKDDDVFFVKDIKGIFVFDKEGRFKNEIGRRGNGPGEYFYIDNFYLDRKNKLVCLIFNAKKQILQYDYNGNYVSTLHFDENDMNIESVMMCGEDEFLAYYPLPNDVFHGDSEYRRFKKKESMLVSDKIMDAKKLTSKKTFYPFLYFPMISFDNQYFFISVFSNKIYKYEDGKVQPAYYIDIPNLIPSGAFLEEHKDTDFFELMKIMKQNEIGTGILALEASLDYLFALVDKNTLIWDKEKGILISHTYNSNLNLYSSILVGGASDEHIGSLSASFFYENKGDIKRGKDEMLSMLADTLSDEDNPVLYQYYFKKNLVELLVEKYEL